ncbi:hypothetical protein HUJ05_011371 [Dendroctonus ponderosae]|nr:hypothetical protein HUJ05_011371 [Dendroctonus ponderosae]
MIFTLLLCLQVATIQGFACPSNFCDEHPCVSQTSCPENHTLSQTFCGCCMRCIPVISEGELCFDQLRGVPAGAVCADGLICCDSICSTPANCTSQFHRGFMVALFYCFLNTEVQNTLKHHFENWKTKKSLGPSRLRSSSRSKDWSPRSRTESLRITEWTLIGAEDIEDSEKRLSHPGVNHHLKANQRRESMSGQPLLTNQASRKFSSETCVASSQAPHLGQGSRFSSELSVSNRESLLMNYSARKESLINQPLFEQSEDSPTDADQHKLMVLDESTQQDSKDVLINHKGESVLVTRNALLRV